LLGRIYVTMKKSPLDLATWLTEVVTEE
jgi:hypothetical protein